MIGKIALTATADNLSKVYGQTLPSLTISYSGFVNGETASSITAPTISTTATTGSSVGPYAISLADGAATNYTLTLQNGTLTITKAPLTIKADNQSKLYAEVNPSLTISYTGFVNGDNSSSITVPDISSHGCDWQQCRNVPHCSCKRIRD